MKLSKAVEGFTLSLAADNYSPVTVANYKRFMGDIAKFLHDPPVENIRAEDLTAFLEHLRDADMAGATLQVYWKTFRSFYNWADAVLDIPRPDLAIPMPDMANIVIVPFTHEEQLALIKACDSRRDKAMVLLMLDTGLRVSEVARLTVRDASPETGAVIVRPYGAGKKSRSRQVFLGSESRRALWVYLASRNSASDPIAPLLATIHGGFLNRNSIRLALDRLAKRSGVKGVHPHKFRHTFAIEYLRNGGDVFTLQRLLGHSSLEMVRRYLDLADSDAQSAHRRASPVDRLKE